MKKYTSLKQFHDFLVTAMEYGKKYTSVEVREIIADHYEYNDAYASRKVRALTEAGVLKSERKNKKVNFFLYSLNADYVAADRVSPFKGKSAPRGKKRFQEVTSYLTSAGEFIFAMAKMNGVKRWN